VRENDMPKIGCVNHDCDKCKAEPSCADAELAAMIMSDCGCSTNNELLLERITKRIAAHNIKGAA
jgi:transcription initiation factor TFIIIB Brf1 subunit/transcription initiation factor TFIIB